MALAQAAGALEHETGRLGKRAARRKERLSRRAVKAVDGSPIMWKELCSPTIEGPDDTNSIIGLVATLAALLFTYAMAGYQNCLHYDLMQMAYVVLFLFLGAAVTVVLSASAITSEKERRCWPILLGTPIGDWEILWQKAAAVFRRCLPIWALLAGHVLLFVVMRYIHPMAIPQVLLIASWVVVFLEGLGLYFSSRLSRTTSSVVASIGFAVTLWVVLPIMLFLSAPLTHGSGPALTATSMNPIVQATVVMTGSGGEANAMKAPGQLLYNWPTGRAGLGECMRILVVSWAAYAAAGLFLAWRAKRGFRRHIF